MSWVRYLLLGDVGQQMSIHDMEDRITAFRNEQMFRATTQDDQVRDLRLKVAVLIKLLIDKNVLTAAEVAELLREPGPVRGQADG